MTIGEFCTLCADRAAEMGSPLPTPKAKSDFQHFAAVLADEWSKGNI